MIDQERAPRNRTITLTNAERSELRERLLKVEEVTLDAIDCTILGDCLIAAKNLAPKSVDLLVLDPPYNLTKRFGENTFSRRSVDKYTNWLGEVLDCILPLMRPTGTVYICGDWHTSASIFAA